MDPNWRPVLVYEIQNGISYYQDIAGISDFKGTHMVKVSANKNARSHF